MKKRMLGSILGLLFISFILGSTTVFAEETNSEDEIQPEVTIYDNEGNLVEPIVQPPISLLGAGLPTKVKYLNNSQSYQSSEFSASGRRYSGYSIIDYYFKY
nr:hypothetical protein JUJ52_15690 [Virgibacillus sp. AGTR]